MGFKNLRADLFVANALKISRNKASELIKDDKILLDNKLLEKNSLEVSSGKVEVMSEIYVSRAAYKLKEFLKECSLNLDGKTAIDVGSSAGGFIEILLQNGVKKVVGVDVGTNQLNEKLKNDKKIFVYENLDIKEFKNDKIYDILTCDVSFISLNLIIEKLSTLFSQYAIILFKPQFEVGVSTKRDKKGKVMDMKAIQKSMAKFELNAAKQGLIMIKKEKSKLKGKNGNEEYFYLFKK